MSKSQTLTENNSPYSSMKMESGRKINESFYGSSQKNAHEVKSQYFLFLNIFKIDSLNENNQEKDSTINIENKNITIDLTPNNKEYKDGRKNITIGVSEGKANQNFLIRLDEIAEQSSFSTQKQPQKYQSMKFNTINHDLTNSKKESEYKYIPNNFKTKDGVAFATTIQKLNIDAGLSGIYNMGNTCFINTAFQCLSAVQPLTDFFLGGLHKIQLNTTNPMGSGGNLVCGMQQDAQEFLAYLLDCLHEDLNRADKLTNLQKQKQINKEQQMKSKQEKEAEEEEAMIQMDISEEKQELIACDAWKDHLYNNRSIIVDLFQGQLKSTLKCLKCQNMSIKFDSFMYLSLPIPQKGSLTSLEDCVEEFTKEEILDEENRWKCPKCKSFQKASKKIDIWKMPSILIIHLKRFEYSPKKRGKIKDVVDFPLKNLNLTPYVSKLQREKPIYDLFAVANHEGYLGGGHYFSYTKHRNNQQWYYFNDDVVQKVKKEQSIVSGDAYMLFYSKMTVDEFWRQTLSEPGLWPHIVNQEKKSKSLQKRVIPSKLSTKFDYAADPFSYNLSENKKPYQNQLLNHNINASQNYSKLNEKYESKYDSHKRRQSQQSELGMTNSSFNSLNQNNSNAFISNQTSFRKDNNESKILNSNFKSPEIMRKGQNMVKIGEMITQQQKRNIVINNNSNNYYINLIMRSDNNF